MVQKHLAAGRTQIAQLLLSSWKETWMDAGRIRWIRVAPKLTRKYTAASHTRWVPVTLVSASRTGVQRQRVEVISVGDRGVGCGSHPTPLYIILDSFFIPI